MERVEVAFWPGSRQTRGGDLLLYSPRNRRRSLVQRQIQAAGKSEYTHAGLAGWWDSDLMLLETLERVGGRSVTLKSQVDGAPGCWDVYESAQGGRWPEWNAKAAVATARRYADGHYGYRGLLRSGLYYFPIIRLWMKPDTDDEANGHVPFCSDMVSIACRAGGVDPVPNCADRLTWPGDLARSKFYNYRFTLIPDSSSAMCRRSSDTVPRGTVSDEEGE